MKTILYNYIDPETGVEKFATREEYEDGEVIPQDKGEIMRNLIETDEPLPEGVELSDIEIGEIIKEKIYEGNLNAELASLAKGMIKTMAVLVQVIGKEKVLEVYKDDIEKLRRTSEIRVQCGLEPFDLSFLD